MLEDLKPIISNLEERIYGMGIHFNIAQKEDRIFTLDVQMSDPTFWDDPDKAREISQEATQLKNAVESYKQLVSDIEDANVMLEMAIEEDDRSLEGEIKDYVQQIEETVENKKFFYCLVVNMMLIMRF